jgi:hypothetical protein
MSLPPPPLPFPPPLSPHLHLHFHLLHLPFPSPPPFPPTLPIEICQRISKILWIVVDLVAPLNQFVVETNHPIFGSTLM